MRYHQKNPRPPVIYRDTHEAIASESEIIEIKRLAKQTARKRHPRDKTYSLKGQLRCAECGGGMHRTIYKFKNQDRQTHYVRCNKHFRNKLECSNKTNIRLDEVKKQLIKMLIVRATQLAEETCTIEENKPESETLIELRNQLAGLEALGNNPAILLAIQDLKNQILLEENRQQQLPKVDANTHKLLDSYCQATFWESMSDDELATCLKSLVDTVSVDSNSTVVSVNWLF